jgi:hypothetical protein
MSDSKFKSIETAPKDGTRILAFMLGSWRVASWELQTYHKKPNPFWQAEGPWGTGHNRRNQPQWWTSLPEDPE